jgi:hypothetical protein
VNTCACLEYRLTVITRGLPTFCSTTRASILALSHSLSLSHTHSLSHSLSLSLSHIHITFPPSRATGHRLLCTVVWPLRAARARVPPRREAGHPVGALLHPGLPGAPSLLRRAEHPVRVCACVRVCLWTGRKVELYVVQADLLFFVPHTLVRCLELTLKAGFCSQIAFLLPPNSQGISYSSNLPAWKRPHKVRERGAEGNWATGKFQGNDITLSRFSQQGDS